MALRAQVTGTSGVAVAAAALLVLVPALSACGSGSGSAGRDGSQSPSSTTGSPGSSGSSGSSGSFGGTNGGPSCPALGGPGQTGPRGPAATPTWPCTPARPGPGPGGRAGQVSVYYLHGEKLAPAHRRTTGTARAAGAIKALLAGPKATEKKASWGTAIPSGTALHSVTVNDRTATVDLSARFASGGGSFSMNARLAQVVFTATQFPTVDTVRFELDGKPVKVFGGEGIVLNKPVGRADFEELSPAVLVESPAIGDTVRSPVRVWGSANVFEAVFRLRVTDAAGKRAADVRVQATSGTGTRGTFDVTVDYRAARAGTGKLTAYYQSPKDGSKVLVAQIPLSLVK